ncbi:GIP [Symbiodinium natans]|uniref:GIP protein n=1 Tax=Symbiodinium natans TaxID=878477 RepID=A0A812JGJ2_9DINO|nr:GIP [Symbiodinium natans]
MKDKGLFKNHFPNIPPAGKSINVPLAVPWQKLVNERKYRRTATFCLPFWVHHGLKDQKLPSEDFRYGIRGQKGASTEDTMKATLRAREFALESFGCIL